MKEEDYKRSFTDKSNKVYKVYLVLQDKNWHCRECDYDHIGTTQIAGSGGIKGLKVGTRGRDGLIIDSDNQYCKKCKKNTRQDRWTGEFVSAIPVGNFTDQFAKRALEIFDFRDVVEEAVRLPTQLTIDHKLPRIRWNREAESFQNGYHIMTDDDIRDNFQLLKRSNGSVSHNLLKSRACERCVETGKRGTPFNIGFFYEGDHTWGPKDKTDPTGCIGCGWYDFAKWRDSLNLLLKNTQE